MGAWEIQGTKGNKRGIFTTSQQSQMMPKERKDTQPTANAEEATEVSPHGCEAGGEITAAADQVGEAGSGTSGSKEDGAAECYGQLSDPEFWKPYPPMEDCPVCLVPLPLEENNTTYVNCCGKTICDACKYEHYRAWNITNEKREKKELPPLEQSCPFCRERFHKSDSAEFKARVEKRIAKGDVEAMFMMALWFQFGLRGFPKDDAKAMELAKKAADMGSAKAMCHLGKACIFGHFRVQKDEKQGISYLENAVKMGHVMSRYSLACLRADEGNFYLATKHFRLAAEAGDKDAMKGIWKLFSDGKLSKTDLEEILRAHQAACDEMDSEDRRRLEAYEKAKAGSDGFILRLYNNYYGGLINAKQLKEVLKMRRNGSGEDAIRKFLANAIKNSK